MMTRQINYHHLRETVAAYTSTSHPTPQLILRLCDATAQTIADDMEGRVWIGLPLGFKVVREPRSQGMRAVSA